MRLRACAWFGLWAAILVLAGARLEAAPLARDTTVTTVVLVRHAEKDTHFVGSDPPLSAAGLLRSHELERVLGDVPFSVIYVTPWSRNRKTAEPLARKLGDSLTVVEGVPYTRDTMPLLDLISWHHHPPTGEVFTRWRLRAKGIG